MKEEKKIKRILILTEIGQVQLLDIDNSPVDEYSKQLSSLLESSKVTILNTSSGSFILRPSKVVGILVSENPVRKKDLSQIEGDFLVEE